MQSADWLSAAGACAAVYMPSAVRSLHCYVEQGFDAINWQRLIDVVKRYTQPADVNGLQTPTVLVDGTMILNYRLS